MIVIIKGKGSRGKTTAIKKLIEKMLRDARFRLYEKSQNFDVNMQLPDRDVWAKFCYGGVHILVMSLGDSEKEVAHRIQKNGSDCDIIICAGHPHHDPTKLMVNRERLVEEIEKVGLDKASESRMQEDNEVFAEDLFNRLVSMAEEKRKRLQDIF